MPFFACDAPKLQRLRCLIGPATSAGWVLDRDTWCAGCQGVESLEPPAVNTLAFPSSPASCRGSGCGHRSPGASFGSPGRDRESGESCCGSGSWTGVCRPWSAEPPARAVPKAAGSPDQATVLARLAADSAGGAKEEYSYTYTSEEEEVNAPAASAKAGTKRGSREEERAPLPRREPKAVAGKKKKNKNKSKRRPETSEGCAPSRGSVPCHSPPLQGPRPGHHMAYEERPAGSAARGPELMEGPAQPLRVDFSLSRASADWDSVTLAVGSVLETSFVSTEGESGTIALVITESGGGRVYSVKYLHGYSCSAQRGWESLQYAQNPSSSMPGYSGRLPCGRGSHPSFHGGRGVATRELHHAALHNSRNWSRRGSNLVSAEGRLVRVCPWLGLGAFPPSLLRCAMVVQEMAVSSEPLLPMVAGDQTSMLVFRHSAID